MKVVDLVARIPKHLDLHFYDFSMNLYRIYNFAGLENKKKKKELFAQKPLEEVFFSRIGPWPDFRAGEAAGGGIPVCGLTGGVGKVGEKLHGVERNPGVGSVGARDGREGLLRGAGAPAAAVVRRAWAAASGSGSTSERQGS